jgi:hypothetical protein
VKFAILYFILDRQESKGTPVGIVMWDPEMKISGLKMFDRQDLPDNITDTNYELIKMVRSRLEKWKGKSGLPYPNALVNPYEDFFWDCVRNLLIHSTRLSETYQCEVSLSD